MDRILAIMISEQVEAVYQRKSGNHGHHSFSADVILVKPIMAKPMLTTPAITEMVIIADISFGKADTGRLSASI